MPNKSGNNRGKTREEFLKINPITSAPTKEESKKIAKELGTKGGQVTALTTPIRKTIRQIMEDTITDADWETLIKDLTSATKKTSDAGKKVQALTFIRDTLGQKPVTQVSIIDEIDTVVISVADVEEVELQPILGDAPDDTESSNT